MKIKSVPNILSILRIIVSVSIFFAEGNTVLLLMVIALIGITDLLDGYIARKYKAVSDLGARLDSLADVVFFVSIVVYFVLYESDVITHYAYFFIAIFAVRIGTLVISYVKNKRLYYLHTIGNKVTGVSIFIMIFLFFLLGFKELFYICLVLSLFSSIEEMLIMLLGKAPDPDVRSLFDYYKNTKNRTN